MPISISINITDVEDAITFRETKLIEAMFDHAEEFIKNGGKIFILRKYFNAEPDLLAIFETMEQVANWKDRVLTIIDKLSK